MAQPATTPALKDLPEWLRLHEAAAVLRQDEQTTRQKLRSGQLPGTKIGRRWRMRREDVEAILAGRKTPAQLRDERLGAEAAAFVEELVADAPPLSEEQRDIIRVALRGARK
jgi:excisionase family DNA binding protein